MSGEVVNSKIISAKPVIEIVGLCKSFGNNHVLTNFDLTLFAGENLVVLGKSGSGKSVLIKCIIGLLDQDAGSIKVFDSEINELDDAELDQVRARVGFLFQSNALYDSMTVRENLEFPLRRHWIKVSQKEVNDMVMEVLEEVGLAHTVDMMPVELSGGMRKRIALARTLILKPEIILYDEPTTGLDTITAKEIIQLMMDIQKKYNTASSVVAHDMNCLRTASNWIILLYEASCYANGTFAEMKAVDNAGIKHFLQ